METPTKPNAVSTRKKAPRKKWLPWLGLLLLLLLIVAGLWPKAAPIETVPAMQGQLRSTINEEGKTRIRQRFIVSSPITGQLRRIPFKTGAEVKAGETVIAVIDPAPPMLLDFRTRTLAETRRDTASANLERSKAAHEFAKRDLVRNEQLAKDKTISAQELENSQFRETSAAKELSAAESALRTAEAELVDFSGRSTTPTEKPVEVKAPASGRLLRVFEESSRVVSVGTPLVEIGDPKELEVVIETLSRDAATIAVGTLVELEQWGGEAPLKAKVRLIEPAAFTKVSALGVEEQRVNVVADIVTPASERPGLGDAFRVEAHIIAWESSNAIKVPSGTLFRMGDQWAAYTVTDGRAHLQKLKTGHSSGNETEILEGVKPGDQLIVYPGDRVHDAQRVTPLHVKNE
ncbi:MAG: yknX [Verrucomicrobiales bacterium]|nr:yknX [Verrucomicrobiales bacterium]